MMFLLFALIFFKGLRSPFADKQLFRAKLLIFSYKHYNIAFFS